MPYISLNPTTNETLKTYTSWDSNHLAAALEKTWNAQRTWAQMTFPDRAERMHRAVKLLHERIDEYAALMAVEMGKPLREGRAEVEKCALVCDYYAVHAEHFVQTGDGSDRCQQELCLLRTDRRRAGCDAMEFSIFSGDSFCRSRVDGRQRLCSEACFKRPSMRVGARAIVPRCGISPASVYDTHDRSLPTWRRLLPASHVHAVTLTGSESAGREVASHAGRHLKKCVLELGGSDAFIVLKDADLELAATFAVKSRFQNCGQSCIAAKRIIPVADIADEFVSLFIKKTTDLKIGDPMNETTQIGPMARFDLRKDLHQQVADSIGQGAASDHRMRTHARRGRILPAIDTWIG